jgi:enoyl-CoA hydratase/carnithine racemase
MPVLVQTTEDRIQIVSLNRPDVHNALDMATLAELPEVLDRAIADPGVDVILLRGEGASFCSGLDLSALASGEAAASPTATLADRYALVRSIQDQRQRMMNSAKPIVAAVKGHVIGGGLELALAADIRIAATDARLSLPEFVHGVSTDTGGAVLTTILAGPSRAKLMLMTGRRVGAEQALSWGLVDELVAPEELDDAALALCRELAKRAAPRLQLAKQLVDQTWDGAIRQGLRAELLTQVTLFGEMSAGPRA